MIENILLIDFFIREKQSKQFLERCGKPVDNLAEKAIKKSIFMPK
ncbi:MAG: hypothetical protein QRY71_02305 [Candidatus Rhabdochlamydia sp.]